MVVIFNGFRSFTKIVYTEDFNGFRSFTKIVYTEDLMIETISFRKAKYIDTNLLHYLSFNGDAMKFT